MAAPEQSKGQVPTEAIRAASIVWNDYTGDTMLDAQKTKLALNAALPAIHAARDQEWQQRLEEVERRRDELQKCADGLFDQFMGQQQRAIDAEAALARREEEVREPMHTLASTIGRGRVYADMDEPKLARRELDEASEALKRLRAALSPSQQDPEVPGCGGSGKVSVGVNEDFDTGALEADDEKECPGCPDCQSTPELGGEAKVTDLDYGRDEVEEAAASLEEARRVAWHWRDSNEDATAVWSALEVPESLLRDLVALFRSAASIQPVPRDGGRVEEGVAWPHETPPGRCVHWPKTCAEVQAHSATASKPCAYCWPEGWRNR